MCEIFSAIGASILGASAITSGAVASTAATTTVGVVAAASTAAGLASTGLGIANSIRSARGSSDAQSAVKQPNRLLTEKTANQLKESKLSNRTLATLRIPLNKMSSTNDNNSVQTNSNTNVGLNIPI